MLVSIKICNCNHISHVSSYYILPMCCKEKEPKDEQLCITVHTINNIHDADPLDNSSNKHSKVSTTLHNTTEQKFQKAIGSKQQFLSDLMKPICMNGESLSLRFFLFINYLTELLFVYMDTKQNEKHSQVHLFLSNYQT